MHTGLIALTGSLYQLFEVTAICLASLVLSDCECDTDVSETVHELVIVRLSLISGSVNGGDEMIILCEKVKKGDLQHCSSIFMLSHVIVVYEMDFKLFCHYSCVVYQLNRRDKVEQLSLIHI